MKNTLVGFILGAFATGLMFLILAAPFDGGEPTHASSSAEQSIGMPGSGDSTARFNQGDTGEQGAESIAAPEGPTQREAAADSHGDYVARQAALIRELDEARQASSAAQAALEELAMERYLAEEPIISPAPLPAEFDWVFDIHYRRVFHEMFQRELVDTAWAGPMESQLLGFIYDRSDLIATYGAPTVRCHTTRCEVTFMGYGVDSEVTTDSRSLFDEIRENMPEMFDCGPGECWAEGNSEDGLATIFVGFTKADQNPRGITATADAIN